MSDRVRVTAFGSTKILPKDDNTLSALDKMKADGVDFKVEPYSGGEAKPSRSTGPEPVVNHPYVDPQPDALPPAPAGSNSPIDFSMAPPGQSNTAPAPQPAATPQGAPETMGSKAMDFAAPLANSATFGFGDELAGLVSPDAKQAVRDRLALAHRRSPVLSGAGSMVGGAIPALATGGGSIPLSMAAGVAGSALQGAGDANDGDRLEGAGYGAATGVLGSLLGGGLGKAAQLSGKTIANGVGNMAGNATKAAGAFIGGQMGHAVEGYGLGNMVAPAVKSAVSGVTQTAAKYLGPSLSAVSDAAGSLLRGNGVTAAINGAVGPQDSAPKPSGNNLPDKVTAALNHPGALGSHEQELKDVADDPGKLKAKISQLVLNDPTFRQSLDDLK